MTCGIVSFSSARIAPRSWFDQLTISNFLVELDSLRTQIESQVFVSWIDFAWIVLKNLPKSLKISDPSQVNYFQDLNFVKYLESRVELEELNIASHTFGDFG